jgi:hypothetical protein
MTRTATSAVDSFCSDSLSASTEPSTSPLMSILSSFGPPLPRLSWNEVSEMNLVERNSCSRCSAARLPATSRASRSSSGDTN